MAKAIVETLQVAIPGTADDTLVTQRETANLEAYHLYLKGRYFASQRNLPKALEVFEQARLKDPGYTLAHCSIADGYNYLGVYGYVSSKVAFERAQAAAELAVATGGQFAEAHFSSGVVSFVFGWDFDKTERELRRAVELRPGWQSGVTGLPQERLSAVYGYLSQVLSWIHFCLGEMDEGFDWLGKGLADRNSQAVWPAALPGAMPARVRADPRLADLLEPYGLVSWASRWMAQD